MKFVYSNWYIVLALLVVGIVACVVAVIKMDKKDKVIISEFVKQANEAAEAEAKKAEPVTAEEKKE